MSATTYATMRAALQRRTTIRVYCAWCSRFLYVVDGKGESGRSDGICAACLERHFPEEAA